MELLNHHHGFWSSYYFFTFASMKMARYHRYISLLFLAMFIAALGKTISCNISVLPFFFQKGIADHGHTHASGLHHHHSHKHTGAHHSHEHEHDGSENNDEGKCCQLLAKTMYSGLSSPVPVKSFFQQDIGMITFFSGKPAPDVVLEHKVSAYCSWKAPPTSIPDIRVFIHSFII